MSAPRDLARIAIASAAAGFGFAGGRSLWRWVEKNWLTAGIALAVAGGVGCVAYLTTRGGRSAGSGMKAGAFLALLIVCFVGMAIYDPLKPDGIVVFIAWQVAAVVVGSMAGFAVRGKREAILAVERHNESFLAAEGIRAVGGREETWIDGSGQEMVMHDERVDAIVFRIPGKRNGRARIELDPSGRMLNYVPS